jgi:hypothetical protein
VHLAHGKLQDDGDGLVIIILLDNLVEEIPSLLPVLPLLQGRVAANLAVLIDDPQAHNLVAIVDELINQPFEGKLGIVVLVRATQKRARSSSVCVILVFGL